MIVFYNPLQKILDAAVKLYPDIDCKIQVDPTLACPPYGETWFGENGEIVVSIAGNITIAQSLEILAHELAHVVCGDSEGHGEKWDCAFSKILEQYENDCMAEMRAE